MTKLWLAGGLDLLTSPLELSRQLNEINRRNL